MSNLQISLAVLGFVVLALIIAYNSWSARRNAPKRADPVEEAQRDPSRHEPGMDTVGHGPDLTHSLREPVLGDFGTAAPGQSPAAVDRFAETDAELAHLVQLEEQQRQATEEFDHQRDGHIEIGEIITEQLHVGYFYVGKCIKRAL